MRKKKKKKNKKAEELPVEKQVIELLDKHLDQCGELIEGGGEGRKTLFDSSSTSEGRVKQYVDKLPSLDAPEFELLRQQDQQIDAKLLEVYDAVKRINQVQQLIGAEIDEQDVLIRKLQEDAVDTTHQITAINKKVNATIKKVGGGRDIFCDCVLFAAILGVIGIIYFAFFKK